MTKIIVEKAFPFSPDGNHVVHIPEGEQDVSERCAEVAVNHLSVAKRVGEKSAPKPLNKASALKHNKG